MVTTVSKISVIFVSIVVTVMKSCNVILMLSTRESHRIIILLGTEHRWCEDPIKSAPTEHRWCEDPIVSVLFIIIRDRAPMVRGPYCICVVYY